MYKLSTKRIDMTKARSLAYEDCKNTHAIPREFPQAKSFPMLPR